ncbi:GNAT family N-acetyltransferase [Micromonospora aurantiaca (nom. illeg.)]
MTATFAVTGPGPAAAALGPDCPDVYFTVGYGAAVAVADTGTWQCAYRPERVLLPYVRRAVPGGVDREDAATPYGYSGVHVAPGCSAAELAGFWSDAVAHWRDTGLVSLFLRFSPLDPESVAAVRRLGVVEVTRRADTIAVDVGDGPDAVWNGMAGRSRTAVRKARRLGMTAHVRPAAGVDLRPGSPFRRLYEATMTRLGSAPWYLFPDGYYRALAAGLDKDLSLAEVHLPDGTVGATALVMRHRDRAHYHLAGSDPGAARDGANNLLVWTMLDWAAGAGCTVVHLGGGVRADDGLFRFKDSFGGRRSAFWTGTVIVDPDRYAVLVEEQARRTGRTPAELAASGYFPAYRWGGV